VKPPARLAALHLAVGYVRARDPHRLVTPVRLPADRFDARDAGWLAEVGRLAEVTLLPAERGRAGPGRPEGDDVGRLVRDAEAVLSAARGRSPDTPEPVAQEAVAAWWRALDARRDARDAAVGRWRSGALDVRTVAAGGLPHRVTVLGTAGPPLVVVNALGQGPGYWLPLAWELAPRRVVVWTPGEPLPRHGSTAAAPTATQVAWLHGVLRELGVDHHHLLGWCTGAAVATAAALRRPAAPRALSLTVVAGSFRRPGRPPELDTAFETQLADLVALTAARPGVADRVRRAFAAQLGGASAGPALTRPHPELDADRSRPFADADALRDYAARLATFWAGDGLTGTAEAVEVPVLHVLSGADEVVSVAAQREGARHYPGARSLEVAGGTHYLMHDHAPLLAELLVHQFSAVERHAVERQTGALP
jgi:pimeloyl-ACP methyl ester carboxylesterase